MPKLPRGYRIRGKLRIAISLTPKTFEALRREAERQGKSFNAAAESVIQCGLLCLAESDAEERS